MTRQNDSVSIKEFEFECTRSYELGIASGYEQAGVYLEAAAIELFKKRLDSDALKLRKLSDDLKEIGNKKADTARQKKMEKDD
jgi:hypothetical protein